MAPVMNVDTHGSSILASSVPGLVCCDEGVVLAAPNDNSSNNNNTIVLKLTNVNGVVHELVCIKKTKKMKGKAYTKSHKCVQ